MLTRYLQYWHKSQLFDLLESNVSHQIFGLLGTSPQICAILPTISDYPRYPESNFHRASTSNITKPYKQSFSTYIRILSYPFQSVTYSNNNRILDSDGSLSDLARYPFSWKIRQLESFTLARVWLGMGRCRKKQQTNLGCRCHVLILSGERKEGFRFRVAQYLLRLSNYHRPKGYWMPIFLQE